MRTTRCLLLATAFAAAPAGAQVALTCQDALTAVARLNALSLFAGSGTCAQEQRSDDAHLLLIAAQVRGGLDLLLFKSRTPDPEPALAQLAQSMWFAGGAGEALLYRTPARADHLFTRLQALTFELPAQYDPGWDSKGPGARGHSQFDALQRDQLRQRIAQLQHYRVLINDPAYFKAHAKLAALTARTPDGFVVGTKAYRQSRQFLQQMDEAAARHPPPPIAPATAVFEEEPDPSIRPLHRGFDGPVDSRADAFASRADAQQSWLSSEVDQLALDAVLARVDFKQELLVALAFGRRTTATGRVEVIEAAYSEQMQGLSVHGRVGVYDTGCVADPHDARPYVLVTVPRPSAPRRDSREPWVKSRGFSNFGDGCVARLSADP